MWRDLLCGLACVRRRNPFRFESDYRNGDIKRAVGAAFVPEYKGRLLSDSELLVAG